MSEKVPLPPFLKRFKDAKTGHTCVYPSRLTVEHFESALRYEAEPNDVFVCAFAKSGTTWMQYIVWLIIHQGRDWPEGRSLRDCVPMLEFDGHEKTRAAAGADGLPRIVKTHFERHLVPYHEDAKYVYVARNPKDVVVSYLFHVRGFDSYGAPDAQIEDMFEAFVHGQVEFGNHTEHVAAWYAARDHHNVHFVLYEELKRDPEGEIVKLANFLGQQYSNALMDNGKEILKLVVQKSSFASMSKAPNSKWVNSERKGTKFVRKGAVGDHKNHLSEEQAKVIDRVMKEKGAKLGIGHLWQSSVAQ